jgi:ankyrin repeat protein
MQDERALEIYRYFRKSVIYIKNPPKKPNKKIIPDLPKCPELAIVEDIDPITLTSKKELSLLLRSKLTEELFWPENKKIVFSLYLKLREFLPKDVVNILFDEHLITTLRENFSLPPLSFQTLVLELPQERISALYHQPFVLSSLRPNLALLLYKTGDFDSFLNHPFNQRLLTLFTELDSNPHHITLYDFAHMANLSGTDIADLSVIMQKNAKTKKTPLEKANTLNAAGESLLHIACIKADLKMVKKLLRDGADCNITDNEGYLPIHRALAKKFTPIVKTLKKHSDPEELIHGKSLLAIAYENGDVQLTNYLLNQKIGLSSVFMGTTILHEFCLHNNIKLVRKILSIDPNAGYIDLPDDQGNTPLKIACARHSFEIIRVLIMYGADINAKTNGHTALHAACANGDYKLAKFLLERGANPLELDNFGNNCRMLSEESGNRKLYALVVAAEAESATTLLEDDDATMMSSSSSISSITTMFVGTPSLTPATNAFEPDPFSLAGDTLEEMIEFE